MVEMGDLSLIEQVDTHTRMVQLWLSSRSPSAECFRGIGVTASSTGIQVPLLNLALGSAYLLETSDASIGAEIERVKDFFARRNVPWYWWLGPGAQPAHLGMLLEKHGLKSVRPELPAMAVALPAQLPQLSTRIQVWQAESLVDLQAASYIRRIAFRFMEGVALDYFEAMADDWLRGDPARLYLAGSDRDHPAAIGALILGAGMPGVYVMATLPEMRGKGLGKAILTAILNRAQKDKHTMVALTASRLGYPLYQQFGFEQIFCYAIYQPAWM